MTKARSVVDDDPRYGAARTTSRMLRFLCALWVVAGIVAVFITSSHYQPADGSSRPTVVGIELVVLILGASILLFMSSVLDLLVANWEEIVRGRL